MRRMQRLRMPAAGTMAATVVLLLSGCDILGRFVEPNGTPTNLAVIRVSDRETEIAWLDNSTNEQGFAVERKTGADGTFVQLDTVPARTTRYQDTGLSPSTKYYYRVRAFNSGGYSAYASEISITTLAVNADEITPEIRILSPLDGANVTVPFDLTFEILNWGHADGSGTFTHYHPFIDDGTESWNLGPVYELTEPYTVPDLGPGVYVITLSLANSDHTFIGVYDSVELTVVE